MLVNRLLTIVSICFIFLAVETPMARQAQKAQQSQSKPASPKGTVILFTGWVGPWLDGTAGTGTDKLGKRIGALGVRVIVADPANWDTVTNDYLKSEIRHGPVAIVGYSMGATAAQSAAMRLQSEGLAVNAMVLIDGAELLPISSNVERAVHFYVRGKPIRAGHSYSGTIRNVNIRKMVPNGKEVTHIGVSRMKALQDAVMAEVLDGDRVRTSAASPAQNSAKRKDRKKR